MLLVESTAELHSCMQLRILRLALANASGATMTISLFGKRRSQSLRKQSAFKRSGSLICSFISFFLLPSLIPILVIAQISLQPHTIRDWLA
ncbi:hypothetical protein BD626DRAFT_510448 [Schizophyllum amplum]|uniref:Uncharacterized protein n=1 Tax=Schizophyllum amplum TaxID=97359 RepID=A0A550C1T2_9AGAR|nr:hypothetical protein BD626DRAFT_510448 [Auriculariopsis ampla]